LQVVPDVEQNQVANGAILETQVVRILHAIQPRVRENVRRDALRDVFLDVPQSGPQFYDEAGGGRIKASGNLAVELCVHPAKDGFSVPEFAVFVNLEVVLFLGDCHFPTQRSGV